jgi:hypothetical protein
MMIDEVHELSRPGPETAAQLIVKSMICASMRGTPQTAETRSELMACH